MLMPMVEPSGAALATASVPVIAARARLVLDQERLAELLLQPLGDQPHDQVGRRARAERHDDLHRFGRPVLRDGGRRAEHRNGERGGERAADVSGCHSLMIALPPRWRHGLVAAARPLRVGHVDAERDQAADRARHPRPQGRRADRVADLLSRAHRAAGRPLLRRHPGRRLARHGDARARDHGAGDARHDDPAGPRGDARLAARAGRGRHAVRLLRGLEGAGLHERGAGAEGNRLRRHQGRGRPPPGRDHRASSPSAACR